MSNLIVKTLGSISPYPKRNMNCPGFFVQYGDRRILLDCGNGISRLLNFPEDLKNLTVIITHYHNDHFGDIGAIQYASYVYHNLGLLEEKVKIYLPKRDFNHNKEAIMENKESYVEFHEITDETTIEEKDLSISFQDNLSHTIESFMVKLETTSKKIVYTSDIGTTNFEGLINFCINADLLICESSFLQKHKSTSKTHMTAVKAGELANLANVKKLLLTHFWPEEDKELYLKEASQVFKNTFVAIENEIVHLS